MPTVIVCPVSLSAGADIHLQGGISSQSRPIVNEDGVWTDVAVIVANKGLMQSSDPRKEIHCMIWIVFVDGVINSRVNK